MRIPHLKTLRTHSQVLSELQSATIGWQEFVGYCYTRWSSCTPRLNARRKKLSLPRPGASGSPRSACPWELWQRRSSGYETERQTIIRQEHASAKTSSLECSGNFSKHSPGRKCPIRPAKTLRPSGRHLRIQHLAEEKGFEPLVGDKPTDDFKSSALDHSATPPDFVPFLST